MPDTTFLSKKSMVTKISFVTLTPSWCRRHHVFVTYVTIPNVTIPKTRNNPEHINKSQMTNEGKGTKTGEGGKGLR